MLSLGHVHKALGNTEDSVHAYRAGVTANPSLGEAWWSLADLKTYRFNDAEVAEMQATLQTEGLTGRDSAALHFALGKAFEDRASTDQAFAHYRTGADLRQGPEEAPLHESFKAERFERQCEKLRSAFAAPAARPAAARSPAAQPRPIFVVGLPLGFDADRPDPGLA